MNDGDFMNSNEFKQFLFKIKQNELNIQIQPRDSQQKIVELMWKPQEYDQNSEMLTIDEAQEIVQISKMLLFARWNLK